LAATYSILGWEVGLKQEEIRKNKANEERGQIKKVE
jgi:hypothetical protein